MPKVILNLPEDMTEVEKKMAEFRAEVITKRLTPKQLEFYIKCLEEGKL